MLLINKTNKYTDSVISKGIKICDNYLLKPISVKKLYDISNNDYYNIREFIDILCFLVIVEKINIDYKGKEIYVSRA